MSRMPVRIAIQKLSSEGWLLSDFRRKLRVKDVTQKSVQDLFSFREIIETRALQKIFEDDRTWEYSFLIEQKLLRMRAARDDYYEYEMHFELITVFDNDRIKDIYYPICDELVRIDLLLSEVVTRDIHIGIEKLVAAIRDKDYDTAYYYLKRDHFGTTIGGYSVAQQVEKHLAELRAAQN